MIMSHMCYADPSVAQKLSLQEYRDLLRSFVRLQSPITNTNEIIKKTPFGRLEKLQDIWLEWLDAVRPEKLAEDIRTNDSPPDLDLFRGACEALACTSNPNGIPRILTMLKDVPNDARICDAAAYVIRVGASEAFSPEGGPCWIYSCGKIVPPVKVIEIAGESQAEYCFRTYGFSAVNIYLNRPDFMRGLARAILNEPDLHEEWIQTCKAGSQMVAAYLAIFRKGSAAIEDKIALGESLAAEKSGLAEVQSTFISIMGQKDSVVGTEHLIRWALAGSGAQAPSHLQNTVARALLRRSLGKASGSLFKAVESIEERQRSLIAEKVLESAGILPPATRLADCGVRSNPFVRKVNISEIHRQKPLYITHHEKLLKWMDMIEKQERLWGAYALMTDEKSRQRFLEIIRTGDPDAISMVWVNSLSIPREVMRSVLALPGLPEHSQMHLWLRLSEEGDDQAYEFLKRQLISHLDSKTIKTDKWCLAIMDEMARRRDAQTLAKICESGKDSGTSSGEMVVNGSSFSFGPSDHALTLLLRLDPKACEGVLARHNWSDEEERKKMLLLAISASAPGAEALLRYMSFLGEEWEQASQSERWKNGTLSLWTQALYSTGTPWCKDQLASMKCWYYLAQLGDMRASQADEKSADTWIRVDPIGLWLLSGEVLKAVEGAVSRRDASIERREKGPFPPCYIKIGGPNLPDMKKFPKEQWNILLAKYAALLPTLRSQDRVTALSLLGTEKEWWPENLLRITLRDPFPPVRLSVLLYLAEHPRDEVRDEIVRIEKRDPYPWCRRVAHEILVFDPDPSEATPGFRFDIPGVGRY